MNKHANKRDSWLIQSKIPKTELLKERRVFIHSTQRKYKVTATLTQEIKK